MPIGRQLRRTREARGSSRTLYESSRTLYKSSRTLYQSSRTLYGLFTLLLLGGSALAACSSQSTGPSPAFWEATRQAPCDGLDTTACMLPFPDDYYTRPDPTDPTHVVVQIPPNALPRTTKGSSIDPTPYERSDGFSPGTTILTHVNGLDITKSAVANESDIASSLAPSAPVVLLDANTGQRWPYWAEMDETDPRASERLFMIHPATNFAEGDRYIVVLRNLVTSSGAPIPPEPMVSAVLRDDISTNEHTKAHEQHLESLLAELAHDGIGTSGLVEVWDFTVASESNISEPALYMRNQTFKELGSGVSNFTVTSVVNRPTSASHPEEAGNVSREITGTFAVPNYLSEPGGPPGSVLNWGPDGLPQVLSESPTLEEPFACEIPVAADADPSNPSAPLHPARIGLYGHGLFGSDTEILDSSVPEFSNAYDYAFCATNWLGLSAADVSFDISVISNLSKFESLVDRLTQSLLDTQVLGNLLYNPAGFASNAAFQTSDHRPLIDTTNGLVYYGNSEGGIMGGAFTALSTQVRRSVLGVPGMDYDVLLSRSVDFSPFLQVLNGSYDDKLVQQFGFDLVQTIWDRAEADGYAEQMTTNPLPGTPTHQVLLEMAYGDHQVANVQTITEARTVGARLYEPVLSAARGDATDEFWGLPVLPAGNSAGSALFVWDSGVPAPPAGDVPPSAGPDPHDTVPRSLPAFWKQMDAFFRTGLVIDPCGGAPCTAPYPPPGS
ncbi:MAG TPA: hypothetical protein VEJ87_02985 [Acidimicrobiales bacterium]|nr:hypothetical protein [Acidimicrobiales bacterium]